MKKPRTLSYKQRLVLAVNRIPKAAVYPYGKLKMYQALHVGNSTPSCIRNINIRIKWLENRT